MQVLVLNSGSSSLKFQLFQMPEEIILCSGLIERIGFKDAKFKFKTDENTIEITEDIPSHKVGLELLAKQLLHKETGIIKSTNAINIVGHRVVHGGKHFSNTTEITKAVKEKIKALSSLAPLHNPPNLEGIEVAEAIFTQAKLISSSLKSVFRLRTISLLVACSCAISSTSLYAQSITEQLEQGLGLSSKPASEKPQPDEDQISNSELNLEQNLAGQIESLKQDMINLNRDLFVLE